MKKQLVYATVAGVAAGVICLLHKGKKVKSVSSEPMREKPSVQSGDKSENPIDEQDVIIEMHKAKEKSAQTVHERHTEAAEIMADAFGNIMKEIEPIEVEKKSSDPVVDIQEVEIIRELDSLSEDLDELLK